MSKSDDFVKELNKKFNGKYVFGVKKGLFYDKIVRVRGGQAYAIFVYMKKNGDLHQVNTVDQNRPFKQPVYTYEKISKNMHKVDPYGQFLNNRKF